MPRITPEKTTRQARPVTREPKNERKKRVPLGTMRSKLSAETREGYHRHWINDKPGRLQQALDGGYEFVKAQGESVGDLGTIEGNDLGTMTSRIVGTHESGVPMRAYLMEIKQEWRDEDVAEKAKAAAEIDEQIRGGTIGDDSELGHEHRYSPDGGIKYDT